MMHSRTPAPVLFRLLFAWCTAAAASASAAPEPVRIDVDPYTTRSIQGHSEVDRRMYFNLCDAGASFDQRVKDDEMYDYLVNDLRISFGRLLGPVSGLVKYDRIVREDPDRPGYADIEHLRQALQKRVEVPGERFRRDFGANLDAAAHGQHRAFPAFMGKYVSEEAARHPAHQGEEPDYLPENVDAAAELSAAVFRYGFDDFTRPRYYEPVNEPHWSYPGKPHLADWHLATMRRMHDEVPGVVVGGPCYSVAYFYIDEYRSWRGYKRFIDNTKGQMDFYSYHVYDYLNWDGEDFNGGRITSGLPLEGILDLVPNYTAITFGKESPIVVSETGGYVTGREGLSGDELAHNIAAERFPGEGFQWEMKVRSILAFNQVSTTIANTMGFLDHPHTVKKAVPFILLNSFGWDPRYYAVLYTPYDFEDQSRWVPSRLHDFFKLFRDVEGRRVKALCPDPDLQVRAFVSGSTLRVVVNNLWTRPEVLSLSAPRPKSVTVRRYGRNEDFTPYLREETAPSMDAIPVAGREALVIIADYGTPIESKRTLEERPYYGDAVAVKAAPEAAFTVATPSPGMVDHAVLRVAYNRPPGSGKDVNISLNGRSLDVPLEDCADRLEDPKHGYATTKLVRIDPAGLVRENGVKISFPDGGSGTVGTVVLRVAAE